MPRLTLRGYVEDARGKKIALVELKEAGTFLVREGDKVVIDPDSVYGELDIIRIDPQGVSVKMEGYPAVRVFR